MALQRAVGATVWGPVWAATVRQQGEKGSVEAPSWAPRGWLLAGSHSKHSLQLEARPTPPLEPGRAGWAKGRGTPRGQEGIPRALQEDDHSKSKAKIQSIGILREGGGWPWGQEWAGPPGFLLPPPSWNLQGHREIQAGISMGSMTHPPQPPNTHQGIKASFLLSGVFREETPSSGDCALTTGTRLHCQTQMRDFDPVQTTEVLPSHYRTAQGGPRVKDPLPHTPLPTC